MVPTVGGGGRGGRVAMGIGASVTAGEVASPGRSAACPGAVQEGAETAGPAHAGSCSWRGEQR